MLLMVFVFGFTGSVGAVPFSVDKDFNSLSKRGETAAKFKNSSPIVFDYDLTSDGDISVTGATWTVSHFGNLFPKWNKKQVILTAANGDEFVLGTLGGSFFKWNAEEFSIPEEYLGLLGEGAFTIQVKSQRKFGSMFAAGAALNGTLDRIEYPSDPPGNETPAPVPEPATMLLFGAGLAGLAGFRKKMKIQNQ